MSHTGREYAGALTTSGSGATCVNWLSVDSSNVDPDGFPDYSLVDASNYCRNPDNRDGGPWCYTDTSGSWESCDLPKCEGQ